MATFRAAPTGASTGAEEVISLFVPAAQMDAAEHGEEIVGQFVAVYGPYYRLTARPVDRLDGDPTAAPEGAPPTAPRAAPPRLPGPLAPGRSRTSTWARSSPLRRGSSRTWTRTRAPCPRETLVVEAELVAGKYLNQALPPSKWVLPR